MVEALVGAAVGVLTIVVARIVRGQRWMYAIGLLLLPTLYALFGMRAGEPAVAARELAYGIPFLVGGVVFAFVDVRRSAAVVGALWILHGLYDLLHFRLFANAGVPDWYPVWCGTVDVVIGGYLLWLAGRIPEGTLRRA